MTRTALLALSGLMFAMTFARAATPQHTATLAGTWDVHIEHFTGRVVNEQWIVEQDGSKVKGKVKTATRDFPLEGTVEGNKINIKVTVGDAYNTFLGTIDGDSIKGDIKKTNDDGTFSAKRALSRKSASPAWSSWRSVIVSEKTVPLGRPSAASSRTASDSTWPRWVPA